MRYQARYGGRKIHAECSYYHCFRIKSLTVYSGKNCSVFFSATDHIQLNKSTVKQQETQLLIFQVAEVSCMCLSTCRPMDFQFWTFDIKVTSTLWVFQYPWLSPFRYILLCINFLVTATTTQMYTSNYEPKLLKCHFLLTLLPVSWLRCGFSSSPITAWMATRQKTHALRTLLSELS